MLDKLARYISQLSGHPSTILLSVLLVVAWGVSGPLFNYSDTWQLVINTSTTVITFLMVFFLQHAQNTNDRAMHVKLDELIRAVEGARNDVRGVEERTEKEIIEIKEMPDASR